MVDARVYNYAIGIAQFAKPKAESEEQEMWEQISLPSGSINEIPEEHSFESGSIFP